MEVRCCFVHGKRNGAQSMRILFVFIGLGLKFVCVRTYVCTCGGVDALKTKSIPLQSDLYEIVFRNTNVLGLGTS